MEKIGKEAHDGLPKRQGSCTCLSELGDKWELASGQNTSRGKKKVLGGIFLYCFILSPQILWVPAILTNGFITSGDRGKLLCTVLPTLPWASLFLSTSPAACGQRKAKGQEMRILGVLLPQLARKASSWSAASFR